MTKASSVFALELLARRTGIGLDRLVKASKDQVASGRGRYPKVPNSYWNFVERLGTGPLLKDGEPFFFYDRLLDAASEYFMDEEVYQDGDGTPVLLFGHESFGTAYGFRETAGDRLIRVDSDRIVEVMQIGFDEFLAGMFVCYPFIPTSYREGVWQTDTGQTFSLEA